MSWTTCTSAAGRSDCSVGGIDARSLAMKRGAWRKKPKSEPTLRKVRTLQWGLDGFGVSEVCDAPSLQRGLLLLLTRCGGGGLASVGHSARVVQGHWSGPFQCTNLCLELGHILFEQLRRGRTVVGVLAVKLVGTDALIARWASGVASL